MANYIDIGAKLEAATPKIKFSENEIYEVNDDKNVIIKMQAALENSKNDELDDLTNMFESLLGKDAVKEIEKNHPGATTRISQMRVIMIAIMAAINSESYETAEKRFRE